MRMPDGLHVGLPRFLVPRCFASTSSPFLNLRAKYLCQRWFRSKVVGRAQTHMPYQSLCLDHLLAKSLQPLNIHIFITSSLFNLLAVGVGLLALHLLSPLLGDQHHSHWEQLIASFGMQQLVSESTPVSLRPPRTSSYIPDSPVPSLFHSWFNKKLSYRSRTAVWGDWFPVNSSCASSTFATRRHHTSWTSLSTK